MQDGDWQQQVDAHAAAVHGFFAVHGGDVERLAVDVVTLFRAGGTLLFCGNGGSACDAMHIAGEFVGRFVRERAALPAIALSADAGMMTAIGNDYGFEHIFARQVEAYGRKGDMLIALSTSGASPNITEALRKARARGLTTVLMTGEKGRQRGGDADSLLVVPEMNTARVQEVHMLALHLLADLVERQLEQPA